MKRFLTNFGSSSNEHLLATILFLNLAFSHSRTKTHFLECKKKRNNNQQYAVNNVIFKVARCTACPKIFVIKIDRLVRFESPK